MQSAGKSASALDITVVRYSSSIEFDCAVLLFTDWRHMIEMQILVMLRVSMHYLVQTSA